MLFVRRVGKCRLDMLLERLKERSFAFCMVALIILARVGGIAAIGALDEGVILWQRKGHTKADRRRAHPLLARR